jgi:hypothetical protein
LRACSGSGELTERLTKIIIRGRIASPLFWSVRLFFCLSFNQAIENIFVRLNPAAISMLFAEFPSRPLKSPPLIFFLFSENGNSIRISE